MASRGPLYVWWDDQHVADITAKKPFDLRFRYTQSALQRWPANTPAVSCSMPVGPGRIKATTFLAGLLPEGNHLQAAATAAGVTTTDVYGLLARYGRDVAGALTIVVADEPPDERRWAVEEYDDESFAAEITGLDQPGLGLRSDSELSLPGLQNKVLVVALPGGAWGRPVRGRPSTHIIKVEDTRYDGMVDLEAQSLSVARAVGLTTVEARTESYGGRRCIVVERYDRITDGAGSVRRLHQEDACQALGVDIWSQRHRAKYEAAGGPSFAQIAGLLKPYSLDPEAELDRLIGTAVFTVAIGNADGHGKNLSLLHDPAGAISLAPLYDTVPTVTWPNLRRNAAMSIGGISDLDRITSEDLAAEAVSWGVGRATASAAVDSWAERILEAVGVAERDLAGLVRSRLDSVTARRPGRKPPPGLSGRRRRPAGSPASMGGQFAPSAHDEPDVSLDE